MLDAAGTHAGSAVPDAAAVPGGQSLTAAHRPDPADRVLATDISPAILRHVDPAAAGITTCRPDNSTPNTSTFAPRHPTPRSPASD